MMLKSRIAWRAATRSGVGWSAQSCEVVADAPGWSNTRTAGTARGSGNWGRGQGRARDGNSGVWGFWGGGDRNCALGGSVGQVVRRRRRLSYCRGGRRVRSGGEGNNIKKCKRTARGGKGEESVEIRSRAVTSRTWNRVTMASGLCTLPCPPTPVTGKVRLNVTCGLVSQPRAPGLLQLLPSMRLSPSSTMRPGGPWSCERGHSTPEVDLILAHSGLSLGPASTPN